METLQTEQPLPTGNGQLATTSLSQKDAVYQFALDAVRATGAIVTAGTPLRNYITKEVRKTIRLRLFDGVKSGQIKLSKTYDDSKLKKYCSSLINNWLKKDSRFN